MRGRWIIFSATLVGIVSLIVSMNGASKAAEMGAIVVPPAPPMPAIVSIKLMPESLTIRDGRDARKVLVMGTSATGKTFDLTSAAKFQTKAKEIEIGADGYIHGKAAGTAQVEVSAAGQKAKLAVNVQSSTVPEVGFVRDVQPIMAKVGCNQGTCHGSAKGKEGFKLSLRGDDSDFDYGALINDLNGRRFNRVNPELSLMLEKPSGRVPHEGGKGLAPESEHYPVVRDGMAPGTKPQHARERATGLEVVPNDIYLDLPGMGRQLVVIAHYSD